MATSSNGSERAPLLTNTTRSDEELLEGLSQELHFKLKRRIHTHQFAQGIVLVILFTVALILVYALNSDLADWGWSGDLSSNSEIAAQQVLAKFPIIDGHIDLPIAFRFLYSNNASAVDLKKFMPGQVDIPRLRKGKVGAFFWSVYVDCPPDSKDFLAADFSVRDTLEQIDIATILMSKYSSTFQMALTAADIRDAAQKGKIAGIIGVEGGHQLGNSIAVLRQFFALGARYMTLTHVCHNAFADSCGFTDGIEPLHDGLSKLGRTLIHEMNRLGMIVDLSHTSDNTALQAMRLSRAPVMWSHSSARAVHDHPRNVPDSVLEWIGVGLYHNDAIVMVNFLPDFVAVPGNATISTVADHVEHIANIAGRSHVGIGSDYDGMATAPMGLEDVSKYPALVAELHKRGWNKYELQGFTGGNLLRIMEGVERVAQEMRDEDQEPTYVLYDKRPDLPYKDPRDL